MVCILYYILELFSPNSGVKGKFCNIKIESWNKSYDHSFQNQNIKAKVCLFVFGAKAPQGARTSSFTTFLDHTQRRTTVGRTPLGEWSARHRDLFLTKHNTHYRQISMPLVGFEPTISAGERPQPHALDGAVIWTGKATEYIDKILVNGARKPIHRHWSLWCCDR